MTPVGRLDCSAWHAAEQKKNKKKQKKPLSATKEPAYRAFASRALWKFCISPRWSAQQRHAERFVHSNWDTHFGLDTTKPPRARCAEPVHSRSDSFF